MVNINDGFAKRMKCISYKSGIHLIFSKTRQTKNNKGILKFKNGKKTYEAIISSNILKNGRYELEFADSFHKSNEFYRKEARLYRVWFRIASNDGTKDRYLHTGSFSRGCITVTDVEYWDEICDILRKSRLKKGVVGIVEVTD